MARTRMTRTLKSVLFYAGAIALCVPPLFVFVWMILTGLKTGVQNISYPPEFIFVPTLENFRAVFEQYNFFHYLMNSLIIATLATAISLVLGLPAAYSIAKYRQGKIGMLILIARMTPFVSYLLPWYITLPLIRPVLIAALMLRSLDNLKEFDMIYTITQGGPGVASETLYLYSYNVGFGFFKAGYGSALMVVVFLVVLVFNVLMNRLRRDASVV